MSKTFSKIYNKKSRYMILGHEYIMQLIFYGIITIIHFRSCNNLADLFTKCLLRDLVINTPANIRLRPFN